MKAIMRLLGRHRANQQIVESLYRIRPELATTLVEASESSALEDARAIASKAVSSDSTKPARAGIYFDDGECVEVWEDGKRIWFGGHIVRGIDVMTIGGEG